MFIGIYGGSIRPGGGLTVLKQIVKSIACIDNCTVVVYTGEQDCSDGLSETIKALSNVEEVRFFPSVGGNSRYLISKYYFIYESNKRKFDLLVSINYFIPAPCNTVVYHLNLLSFMKSRKDSTSMMLKRLDARLACRRANLNIFESYYLYEQASNQTNINNGHVIYVSIDPEFHCHSNLVANSYRNYSELEEVIITVVSSPSPHKDNSTCLRALSNIISKRKNVNWKMVFVGGLSVTGWVNVKKEAISLGLVDNVIFYGPMSKIELSILLNSSLCLMNASLIESFCMVAVEAMSSCCPVIVTDATSMPESVGEAGIIVPQGDAAAFAESVELLYDNDEVRNYYIKKGVLWANNFSPEQFRTIFNTYLLG